MLNLVQLSITVLILLAVSPHACADREVFGTNKDANFKLYRKHQNHKTLLGEINDERSSKLERSGAEDEERLPVQESVVSATESLLRYLLIRNIDENIQKLSDAVLTDYGRGFPLLNNRKIAGIARTKADGLAGAIVSPRYMSDTKRRPSRDPVKAELEAKLPTGEIARRLTPSAAKRRAATAELADELPKQLGMYSVKRDSALSPKLITPTRRLSTMNNNLAGYEARLTKAEDRAEAEDITSGLISPKFVRSIARNVAESEPTTLSENKRRLASGSHLSVRKALDTIASLFREPERRVRTFASPNFLRFG